MAKDAIELLTSDHREVEALFEQVESGSLGKKDAIGKMVRELSIHNAIERQLLYPAVRQNIPSSGEGLAEHSLDEHEKVARLLADIESAVEGAECDRLLAQLIPDVKAHVEEEENEIFPKLRNAMRASELAELGAKLEKAKSRAPTHPHPHAPRSGVGAKVGGMAASVMDKVRDSITG